MNRALFSIFVTIAVAGLLLTGCGQGVSETPTESEGTTAYLQSSGEATSAAADTGISSGGGGTSSALVDTVRFGGVLYEASVHESEGLGRSLEQGDLGPKYGEVRYRLASYDDPDHEPANGDAAYLRPGTPVYAVESYDTSFWLAAPQRGHLTLYEAVSNPKAQQGSDLLDVGGKVRRIDLTNWEDTSEVYGTFDDPEEVRSLVRGLMGAPAMRTDPDYFGIKNVYLVVFHLKDGMAVARKYRADTGRLAPGIVAPRAFRATVGEAVERQ